MTDIESEREREVKERWEKVEKNGASDETFPNSGLDIDHKLLQTRKRQQQLWNVSNWCIFCS